MKRMLSFLFLATFIRLNVVAAATFGKQNENIADIGTILRTFSHHPHHHIDEHYPRTIPRRDSRKDQPCNGHPTMPGYPAAGFRPKQTFELPTETVHQFNIATTLTNTYGAPPNSNEAPAQNGQDIDSYDDYDDYADNYDEESKITYKRDLSADKANQEQEEEAAEEEIKAEAKVTDETLQQQQTFDNDDSDVDINNTMAKLQQQEAGIQQQEEATQQQTLESFEVPLAYLQIPVQFIPVVRKQ